jgi:hypothetical protein
VPPGLPNSSSSHHLLLLLYNPKQIIESFE